MIRRLLKHVWLMLWTTSLFFVSSCTNLPDKPICAEITISKGRCSYIVSGKQVVIDDDNLLDGKTWFDLRRQSLTVPAQSWAEIKAWIIKMCKKHGCNSDVSSWDRTIETIDSAVNNDLQSP